MMTTDNNSLNQLITAIIKDDADEVIEILNEGIDPSATEDEAAITPLHFAAQNNALNVIPALMLAGASLEACTQPEQLTPLDIAILHGHMKVAQLLLAYQQQAYSMEH